MEKRGKEKERQKQNNPLHLSIPPSAVWVSFINFGSTLIPHYPLLLAADLPPSNTQPA
jgi:hypothetical protein